ncbi:hypothetical protein ABF87_00010 [Nitrosomonas sp. JL21]|nr:hypothetical protein [Nitrosomonas sp. JL21]
MLECLFYRFDSENINLILLQLMLSQSLLISKTAKSNQMSTNNHMFILNNNEIIAYSHLKLGLILQRGLCICKDEEIVHFPAFLRKTNQSIS